MLLSKDMSQIAIMRSIGLTSKKIKPSIYGRNYDGSDIGNHLGVMASTYLGEFLVSLAMSTMGAAKIELVNVFWQTWMLCPLALMIVVGFTIYVSCKVTVKDDLSVVLRS